MKKKKLKKELKIATATIQELQITIERLNTEKWNMFNSIKDQNKLWMQRCKQLKEESKRIKENAANEWMPGGPL